MTVLLLVKLYDALPFGVVVAIAGLTAFGASPGYTAVIGVFTTVLWIVCGLIADTVRWIVHDHNKRTRATR